MRLSLLVGLLGVFVLCVRSIDASPCTVETTGKVCTGFSLNPELGGCGCDPAKDPLCDCPQENTSGPGGIPEENCIDSLWKDPFPCGGIPPGGGGGGGGGTPGGPPPTPPPPPKPTDPCDPNAMQGSYGPESNLPAGAPIDADNNGVADCWRHMTDTSDPNADTLDSTDRFSQSAGCHGTGTRSGSDTHWGIDVQCDPMDPVFAMFTM